MFMQFIVPVLNQTLIEKKEKKKPCTQSFHNQSI